MKADTIIAFFGFNEAFDGPDHVDRFRAELTAFVKHTLGQQYNGKSAPKLVLVSPIAFEDRSDTYDLPKGDAENKNFALYTDAIRTVAEANALPFVDLFSASQRLYARTRKPLTVNGSHLNDDGYAATAAPLVEGIYGSGRHRAKAKGRPAARCGAGEGLDVVQRLPDAQRCSRPRPTLQALRQCQLSRRRSRKSAR